MLRELKQNPQNGNMLTGVQRASFLDTGEEYLCIALAKHGFPTVNRNVSVTLGVLLDDHAKQAIKFWDDPAITQTTVNITCERCPINDCSVRAAAPKVVERREARKKMQEALAKLTMLSE
jgi:predicted transcriptional regulator